MDLEKIFKEYRFSDIEKQFMRDSGTSAIKDMNQSRIISEFILGKRIKRSTEAVIKTNRELSASNDIYSHRIAYLTGALVFVGIIQVIIQIL